MQPLKITIRGYFWDTQIYKDKLYLFDLDGSLQLIDWPKLVNSFKIPERCRVAMQCAFLRSDYLYGNKWNIILGDSEVKELLLSKYKELASFTLDINIGALTHYIEDQEDTPFPFAHNDSLFYNDHLYVASQSGIFSERMSGMNIPSTSVEARWDAPVSSLDVHNGVLALAAGEEGLFRFPSETYYGYGTEGYPHKTPNRVNDRISNKCYYIRNSVLSFAHNTPATLVEYNAARPNFRSFYNQDEATEPKQDNQDSWENAPVNQLEVNVIHESYNQDSLCWGSKDRICIAGENQLTVIKYNPYSQRRRNVANLVSQVRLDSWKGNAVSGANAVFGTILELDNALVIVRSDSNIETVIGEPVNWRIFPRSRHFGNQLHIIYDDRLEIISYNHDYFVEQQNKPFGSPHAASPFMKTFH